MRGIEGIDGITQSVFLTDGLEQSGGHTAAQNGTHQCIGIPFLCLNGNAREGKAQMVLFNFLRPGNYPRLILCRFNDIFAFPFHGRKQVTDECNIILCIGACNRYDGILGTIIL